MKKTTFAALAIVALGFTSCKKDTTTTETTAVVDNTLNADLAGAETYALEVANSELDWEGGKVSGDTHEGEIKFQSGNVLVKDGQVVGGEFILDMNSITVKDLTDAEMKAKLEGHLKGTNDEEGKDHFFNVQEYPTATFTITNVVDAGEHKTVTGNLTLKGQTQPVTFMAKIVVDGDNVSFASEDESIVIDRTKWNVNYNSGSKIENLAADKIIKDEIKIDFTALLKKQS